MYMEASGGRRNAAVLAALKEKEQVKCFLLSDKINNP